MPNLNEPFHTYNLAPYPLQLFTSVNMYDIFFLVIPVRASSETVKNCQGFSRWECKAASPEAEYKEKHVLWDPLCRS